MLLRSNINKCIAYFSTLILSSTAFASTAISPATFSWTGVYVGGFVGGATSAQVTTNEPLRLDNHAYWFRPYHNSFSYNTNPSFIGGGTIGYNWQIGKSPYLVGLEGEYGYLNLHGSSVDPNQYPYAALPTNNLTNNSRNVINIGNSFGYGLIGGRIGYARDRILFYIKTGAVITDIQSKYHAVKTEDLAPAYLNISGVNNIVGYGIGGGIEYFLPFKGFTNVSTKVEYLYLGINKTQYAYGHCSCHFLWRAVERVSGVNTVKIGMNYKFG